MFINRFRSLYSLRFMKPALLVPPCNTRSTTYYCTKSEENSKPEDTFGNYAKDLASRYPAVDCEDDPKVTDMSVLEALNEIKRHINNHDFDQANEVFLNFRKTKKPPPHMYKLLFASAARLGKAQEAFKIYNDLKKRGLYADGAMFTSLFYACAKCPRSDIALPIAEKLTEYLFQSKKFEPNISHFNVMMMAYGRHHDITKVMLLIDKLEEQGIRITRRNYNFALDSCISQKNVGLRYALLIWHHMLKKKVVPGLYAFTAMGRCVRDCSLGDSKLHNLFIDSIFKHSSQKKVRQVPTMRLNSGESAINLKEEPRQFHEGSEEGGDVKQISGFVTDNEFKFPGTVLTAQNSRAEVTDSADRANAGAENVEEIQEDSHVVKAESSNDCSSVTEEESQSTTRIEVAASEKAVSSTVGDGKELMDVSETADRSEVPEIRSEVEFSSQEATHRFDSSELPNLLTLKPPGKSIINFGDFSVPHNRLMLFGGLSGFLKTMEDYKVKPDIKLFSVLLGCIPPTTEDEEALVNEIRTRRVKVDTTFLNILIQRRVLRKEESTIEDYLDLFKRYKCRPDAVTLGTIARSCVTHESGMKCIQLARSHNIRLNKVILGCLLENARKTGDVTYASDILKAGKEDDTELDTRFTSTLKSIVENEKMKRQKSISQ